jgi:hypothetical protein
MRHLRNAGLAVLVLALSAQASFAQRSVNTGAGAGAGGFWEFGVDFAALVFGMDNPSTTSLSVGGGSVRAGRFISDVLSVEPRVSLGYSSSSGTSFNFLAVEVGVLYHLQSDHAAPQWYVRPLLIFDRSSFTSGGSTTSTNRTGIGAGFGMKRPSKKNSKFTWRAEATYRNMMKSGTTPSSSELAISGGVSVFTK